MINLSESKLFTPITNADNGVTIYLLTQKVAPVQQNFYFVNDGMTGDGHYLWFYCAYPPSPVRTLGLVDLESQVVRHFSETQFSDASPYVDPISGFVFLVIFTTTIRGQVDLAIAKTSDLIERT